MEVGLFVPCYVDQCYPQVAMATAEVLERFGVRVHVPEGQTCCGQPMANSGCRDDAAPLARRMIDVFASFEHVVCPSGSCTSMVRHHFQALLPGEPRLRSLVDRTHELCEFLHDVLRVTPRGRFAHRVGVHQSCHGLRELRLGAGSERQVLPFDKIRALLGGLEGIKLTDTTRADECCGFGGTFSVNEEAISCAMGRDRITDQLRAGAEIVTGADMSCLMHLEGILARERQSLKVMHVAEILREAGA